ncbi:hypothetical protein ABW20_dc0104008 [Dactylellina cionopaga]|nr:hypothetical protein ABW20_dc0104008 [Dactylellina cionopaga]
MERRGRNFNCRYSFRNKSSEAAIVTPVQETTAFSEPPLPPTTEPRPAEETPHRTTEPEERPTIYTPATTRVPTSAGSIQVPTRSANSTSSETAELVLPTGGNGASAAGSSKSEMVSGLKGGVGLMLVFVTSAASLNIYFI